MTKNNKLSELEYLRGFGILAVIVIHVTGNFTSISKFNYLQAIILFVDWFAHFAVPLFIFVSGFVLFLNYRIIINLSSYFKRRFFSVVPQYLIISCIYMLWNERNNIINGFINITYKDFVNNIIFATSSYHLWFFLLLFQFYLIYPLIVKIYKKNETQGRKIIFIIICLLLQITWNLFIYLIAPRYSVTKNVILRSPLFLSHIFYFVMGMYVCDNYDIFKKRICLVDNYILLFCCIVLNSYTSLFTILGLKSGYHYYEIPHYYNYGDILINPILYITVILLLIKISIGLTTKSKSTLYCIRDIGNYSFPIYLIHIIVINLLTFILNNTLNIDYNSIYFYFLLFISTVIVSFYLCILLSYLPFSKFIIGVHNKKLNRKGA